MSGEDLEMQSWTATDQVVSRHTTRLTGFHTTRAEARFNGLDTRTSKRWSVKVVIRFGVA